MRILRGIGTALAGAGVVAVVLGYGGALHPALDAWTVFRVPLALMVILLLLLLRRPLWGVLPLVALMAAVVAPRFWALWRPEVEPSVGAHEVVLYQKNLLFRLATPDLVVADIRARRPDVVTVQEVSRPNQAVLTALREEFPAQNFCDYREVGGPAVLSHWPMVPGSAICGPGLAAMQVQAPWGMIWAISIHLRWPWPFPQPGQIGLIEPLLHEMSGAKVIGGDFNNVAWSEGVARIARASDTQRIGREAATFSLPHGGLGVGIDHILATGGEGRITVLGRLGSDHHGLLGRIFLAP
ncbi:endonuclease/exonuclease/phosphatase family protein [Pseudodonghicola sp.]|uniref:endonuclease/exonuclease/phosphatase family protein n=1 Tax=Pseudodonghicola sp. TaxID=1969463 RepID=UPI003A983270